MSDFECADCKTLWRNYAEATTKYVKPENQQRKAASMGYLNLFKTSRISCVRRNSSARTAAPIQPRSRATRNRPKAVSTAYLEPAVLALEFRRTQLIREVF